MFFKNIVYTVDALLRYILGIPMKSEVGRCNASLMRELGEKELAVLITGCDVGFGRDLAYSLADRGFVVFAACQTEHGSRQFYSRKKYIVGIKCDITKEEEVTASAKIVSTWLMDSNLSRPNRIPRYLHAVINNASSSTTTLGVDQQAQLNCGPADCFDISEYRKAMEGKEDLLYDAMHLRIKLLNSNPRAYLPLLLLYEVDFFGQISVTTAFLPILKSQQVSGTRIINVSTVAGLLAGIGPSPYSASKFAMEAFADNLRLEVKHLGIHVVTVNSSYHHRPMMQDKLSDLTPFYPSSTGRAVGQEAVSLEVPSITSSSKAYSYISPIKMHHIQQQVTHHHHNTLNGENTILLHEVLSCVELSKPPPRVIVGSDVKFLLYPLRLLPSSMQLKLLDTFTMLGHKMKV